MKILTIAMHKCRKIRVEMIIYGIINASNITNTFGIKANKLDLSFQNSQSHFVAAFGPQ